MCRHIGKVHGAPSIINTNVNQEQPSETISCDPSSNISAVPGHSVTYPCEICGQRFESKVALDQHIENEHIHGSDLHQSLYHVPHCCTHCEHTFDSLGHLTNHVRVYHEERISLSKLHCNKCDSTFHDMVLLNVHMKEHHKDEPPPTPNSSDTSEGKSILRTCHNCKDYSENGSNVNHQLQNLHGGTPPYQCITCDKTFYESSFFGLDPTTHSVFLGHTCTMCDVSLTNLPDYYKHMKSYHDLGRSCHCDDCEIRFHSSQELENHIISYHNNFQQDNSPEPEHMMYKHGKDVDLMCHECDNFFVSESALSIHTITYHPKVQCHLCDFFAQLPNDLMNHIQIAHNHMNSFSVCSICENTFLNSSELEEHMMNNHRPTFNFNEFADLVLKNDCSPLAPTASSQDATVQNLLGCLECKKTFELYVDLTDHMKELHQTKSFFSCDICELVFPRLPALQSHLDEHHIDNVNTQLEGSFNDSTLFYPCDYCEIGLTSLNELEAHIKSDHEETPIAQFDATENVTNISSSCDSTCKSRDQEKNHTEAYHMQNHHESPDYLQPITSFTNSSCTSDDQDHFDASDDFILPSIASDQLDGNNTIELIDVGPENEVGKIPSSQAHSIRNSNYAFNQKKQTEKIRNDASINDYEVTINNSDQNATIKCSTGFYIQVARASLGTLKMHSVLSCNKIAITVDKVTVSEELSGMEATCLIHFSFMSEQKSLGGATVHLHHSTRTIQIQGSATMPDYTRSAVWFLNNFILVRFLDQAKANKFAIRNTNAATIRAFSNSGTSGSRVSPSSTTNTSRAVTVALLIGVGVVSWICRYA
jgi:hypothetical protein